MKELEFLNGQPGPEEQTLITVHGNFYTVESPDGRITYVPDEKYLKPASRRKIKIKFIFAWYDFWVGFYWDRKRRVLYFFPFPCFGILVKP